MEYCRICHRSPTIMYNIQLLQLNEADSYNGRIIRRAFGDKSGMLHGQLVCSQCSNYVCPRERQQHSGSWNCAWPAVMWTCLSVADYAPIPQFMQLLPETLRHSWLPSIHLWTPPMQQSQDEASHFRDLTMDIQNFDLDIQTGQLGRIMAQLNSHPFPEVRCPQGCTLFIDDYSRGRLDKSPACHYLRTIIPAMKSFGADASQLSGARPDWILPFDDLEWTIKPCLIITEDDGLCFLHCSDKVHASSSRQWLHVPTNPILGNRAPLHPDVLAPAVISANCVRAGRSNAHNTSFPVYEQIGNTQGLSTFQLGLKRPALSIDHETAMAMGLVFTNRTDILHITQQSEYSGKWIQDVLDHYGSSRPPHEELQLHSSVGSYITAEAAHYIAEAYNNKLTDPNQSNEQDHNREAVNTEPKDCLFLVHPVNDHGRFPFSTQYASHRDDAGQLYLALLFVLLHSEHLIEALTNAKWRTALDGDRQIHSLLLTAIRKIRLSPSTRSGFLKTESKQILQQFVHNPPIGEQRDQRLGEVIRSLCHDVDFYQALRVADVTRVATESDRMIILINPDDPGWDAPQQLLDGKWTLMFGVTPQARLLMSFRWSASLSWQTAGSHPHNTEPGRHPLLLYVRDSQTQALRRAAIQFCCGQDNVVCSTHEQSLIRERRGTEIKCCLRNCRCLVQWRCPFGFPEAECTVGVCRKHFESIIPHDPMAQVTVGRDRPPVPGVGGSRRRDERVADHDDADEPRIPAEEDELQMREMQRELDDIAFDFNDGDDFSDDQFLPIPMTTTVTHEPKYKSERSSSVAGHYFLNPHLRVMARSKIMRKPPVALLQILQNICSTSPEWSVPLIYPEAMLFPRIFWALTGNSVIGAIPSVMYSNITDSVVLKGLANIKDHSLVRMLDTTLLTSHDQYYIQYVFDVLLNSSLNTNSAVIACHRGLEAVVRDGARFNPDSQEEILKFDEADAKREVNRLVSLLRTEGHWTYFITLTCNDARTCGVAPIRNAIKALSDETGSSFDHLLQNYCVILTRAWERTAHYVWQYIVSSPERPVGHVKSHWMRFEFQSSGALGNRPHVHGGVTLHEEPMDITLSRVRCSNADMWNEKCATDFDTLVQDGIIKNDGEYSSLMDLASRLQQHSCDMARQRCKKRRLADDTFICRVLKHPPSFDYCFEESTDFYDDDVYVRLEYLDLAVKCTCGTHWFTGKPFKAGIWHYPSKIDEHFVPTIPRVFVALQASTNVQVCDRKFQVSYLAKYAAGQNEGKQVTLSAADDKKEVDVRAYDLINIKISGQRMHPANQRPNALARELALTEMIWFALRFPFVVSSTEFTHASTKPPEYRAAIVKPNNQTQKNPLDGGGGRPTTAEARLPFPEWRQFTDSQIEAITNYESSRFYLDKTSSFSLRPPELRIVDQLELYLRWFTCERGVPAALDADLVSSSWIDGADRCVKIRKSHVSDVADYINRLTNSSSPVVKQIAIELFATVIGPIYFEHRFRNERQHTDLYLRFVDATKLRRNVVVFPTPSPSYVPNFLVHLLLTMGHFVTEKDLYSGGSMRSAFQSASLLPVGHPDVQEVDLKILARKYVLQQLLWLPIGSRTFGLRLKQVLQAFASTFLNAVDALPMPQTSEDLMQQNALETVRKTEATLRETSIQVLQHENIPNFPDPDLLRQARAQYHPVVLQTVGQSDPSHQEQSAALASCVSAIDNIGTLQNRSVLLVGPPGCGKTHILLIANTYTLSKNLKCALVAITSERARRLGGEHIHLFFCIPVVQTKVYTVNGMVSQALLKLARSPLRFAILQRLQVLFIEEISLLSAEMLAVMDMILRYVRRNDSFLGGVLAICTGDPCQLAPVEGSQIWSSHHMVSSLDIIKMQHFVRAAEDLDLQRLITILRSVQPTTADIDEFVSIMRRRCIPRNCVASWDDVPNDVMRIVGTKAACQEIIDHYIDCKKTDPTVSKWTSKAFDEAETGGGMWSRASQSVTRSLNKCCLEPDSLFIFQGQVLRLTYNHPYASATVPRFSQGQCCVVRVLPNAESNKLWIQLVPPGHRNFHPEQLPENEPGFEVFALEPSSTPSFVVAAGQMKARRTQYRLTYFVSSTVHRALGETCPRIATHIAVNNHKYRLWERSQLLVVLSRVPRLDCILFVSEDHEDTILAMKKTGTARTKYQQLY